MSVLKKSLIVNRAAAKKAIIASNAASTEFSSTGTPKLAKNVGIAPKLTKYI